MSPRKPHPTDLTDEEWAFVAPYLTLLTPAAPQCHHKLREVFNAARWLVRFGAPWHMLPHDFPPWAAVYQQTQRWIEAGCFEAMVEDLRLLLRLGEGRKLQPSAAIFDSQSLQSIPGSGHPAGYDSHKRRKGSKVHAAVDILGHLLALYVTPANTQGRTQVAQLASSVQEAPGEQVTVAFVDQDYTGEAAEDAAQNHVIQLQIIKLDEAKRGFVLLPQRWVVERPFA
jgi:transposase